MIHFETSRLIIKTNLELDNGILVFPKQSGNLIDLKPHKIEDGGFAVYLKETDNLVCHIGIRSDRKPFELTIGTEDGYKRKGYMSEAHSAVIKWIFDNCKTESICALVGSLTPEACRKILSRDGFSRIDEGKMEWWIKKRN